MRISNSGTKAATYSTLVRRNLEYCASESSPYTVQSNTSLKWCKEGQPGIVQIDIISRTRICYKTLESRQMKIQLIMLCKIINDLVDIQAEEYLTPASTRTRALHSKKPRQYPTKTDTFKFSFFPRTIPTWNSLPASFFWR